MTIVPFGPLRYVELLFYRFQWNDHQSFSYSLLFSNHHRDEREIVRTIGVSCPSIAGYPVIDASEFQYKQFFFLFVRCESNLFWCLYVYSVSSESTIPTRFASLWNANTKKRSMHARQRNSSEKSTRFCREENFDQNIH